jgi:hypothetical protein
MGPTVCSVSSSSSCSPLLPFALQGIELLDVHNGAVGCVCVCVCLLCVLFWLFSNSLYVYVFVVEQIIRAKVEWRTQRNWR